MARLKSLVLAVVAVLLLIAGGCGGGRGIAVPPPTAPAQPPGDDQQAVPPGSDAEGSHEEQSIELPSWPPWEPVIPPGYEYPTWTDPETGCTYVFYNYEAACRHAVVIFKPDEWWIEEDYPIEEDTPPWKIYEEAAVEELRSRGYDIWPQYNAMEIVPHWYHTVLPEGTTFFDVEYVWPEEFPCIDTVTPDIYIWLL